jgi:hypothetical protein
VRNEQRAGPILSLGHYSFQFFFVFLFPGFGFQFLEIGQWPKLRIIKQILLWGEVLDKLSLRIRWHFWPILGFLVLIFLLDQIQREDLIGKLIIMMLIF